MIAAPLRPRDPAEAAGRGAQREDTIAAVYLRKSIDQNVADDEYSVSDSLADGFGRPNYESSCTEGHRISTPGGV